MEWYKTLSIHQKINVKAHCQLICGLTFESLRVFFSYQDCFDIIHMKLKHEGFDV